MKLSPLYLSHVNYKSIVISFFILCFSAFAVYSQTEKLNYISKLKPLYVDSIKRIKTDTLVYVKFEFAKSILLNPKVLNGLKERTVTGVDLVYSTHIESVTFDQYKLNLERLQNLKKAAIFLFESDNMRWRVIGETRFKTNADAQNLFSGFVLHLRPKMTIKETEAEIEMLDDILEGKESIFPKSVPINRVKPTQFSYKMSCHFINSKTGKFEFGGSKIKLNKELAKKPKMKGGENAFYKLISEGVPFNPERKFKRKQCYYGVYSFEVTQDGVIQNAKVKGSNASQLLDDAVIDIIKSMKPWNKGQLNNQTLLYNFTVTFGKEKIRVPYSNLPTNVVVRDLKLCNILGIDTTKSTAVSREYFTPDSTIIKILNRNKKWNKMLVVADLTGSMYVYTAQLLLWFKIKEAAKENTISHVTFFNDGDEKDTFQKNVGSVGGIYNSDILEFDDILELAKTTMRNGNGGDVPENNVEAVINGINNCKDCNDVVLISDNYATPRDLTLVNQITKPIKLVLCGTWGGINPEYLDFIRQNKGSLHTMNSDLVSLIKTNEGQVLEIEGLKYFFKNGHFSRLY